MEHEEETPKNIKENKTTIASNDVMINTTASSKKYDSLTATGDMDSLSISPSLHKTSRQTLARIDCPEKIVICIDISSEMNRKRYRARAGTSYSGLELVKRALKLLIFNKQLLSSPACKHSFALVVLLDEALWLADFTSELTDLFTHIDELQAIQSSSDKFDLSTLFDALLEKARPPSFEGREPPYIVRVILVYGRSHCLPVVLSPVSQNLIMSSQCFFIDVVYLNEPPESENLSEAVYQELCDLDHRGLSHVYDASRTPTKVFDAFAKLVAHPLQRATQMTSGYTISPMLFDDNSNVD